MDFLNGKLQVFLGPREHGASDNLEDVIIDFIDQAEETLDVAVQELDNRRIADALDRASRRQKVAGQGRVRVRLVTEGDYLKEDDPLTPPDRPSSLDPNRDALVQLFRAAVDAKVDFNPKIFHHKFILRDRRRPRAAALTGSTNFTHTGTHANLNHVVVFHHDGIVDAYQQEFDQLRKGIFGARSPELTTTDPLRFSLEGTEVEILFSPDHNPELRIVNEILKAQSSAHLLMFTFAKSTTIDEALKSRLDQGGFRAQGVLDGMQAGHSSSPHPELIASGARLRRDTLPGHDKLHHKLLVLDDRVTIGGSFNYTGPANRYNDENLFIIRNPAIAAFFRAEVDRVFNNLAQDF